MKTSAVLCLMALAASASATLRGATYMLMEENDAPVFLDQYEANEEYAAKYNQPPPPPASYKKPSKKPAASYAKPATKPSGQPKYSSTTKKQPYIFVSEDMDDADIGRAVLDAMRDDTESYSPPSQSYDQPPASNYQAPPPSSYKQPPPTYLKPSSPYQQPPASYQQPPASYQQPPASYQQPPASYQQPPTSYQQPPSSYQQPPKKKKPSYQRPSYKKPPPTYLKPSTPYQKPSSQYQQPASSYNQPKPSAGEKPCPTHQGSNNTPKGKYFILVSDDAEDTEEVDAIAYDVVTDDGDVFLDTWESNADMEARKKKKKKKGKKPTKYNLLDQRLRLVALADVEDVSERDLASDTVMDDGDYLISINQHAADDDDAMFLADDAPTVGVPNPGFKPEKKKTNFFGNGKTMLTDETFDDVVREAENIFIADRKRVPQRYHKKNARVLDAIDDADDEDETSGLDLENREPTHLLTPSSGGAFNSNSGVKTYFLRSVSEDDGDEDVGGEVNDSEVNGGGDDIDTNFDLPNPWEDSDN